MPCPFHFHHSPSPFSVTMATPIEVTDLTTVFSLRSEGSARVSLQRSFCKFRRTQEVHNGDVFLVSNHSSYFAIQEVIWEDITIDVMMWGLAQRMDSLMRGSEVSSVTTDAMKKNSLRREMEKSFWRGEDGSNDYNVWSISIGVLVAMNVMVRRQIVRRFCDNGCWWFRVVWRPMAVKRTGLWSVLLGT